MRHFIFTILLCAGVALYGCSQNGASASPGETGNNRQDTANIVAPDSLTSIPDSTEADVAESEYKTERITILKTHSANGKKVKFEISNDTTLRSDIYNDDCYVLLYNGKLVEFINKDEMEDGRIWDFDESVFARAYPMYYFQAPGNRYLYVTLKPSMAGSCGIFYNIHVYRIDCNTGKATWITNCGGIEVDANGFHVAEQEEWLNPDKCCAEARFTARTVYYSFNGKPVRRSAVMKDHTIAKKYGVYYTDYSNGGNDDVKGPAAKLLKRGKPIRTI